VVGSELVSRSLRQSRYAGVRAGYDAEFLRWTLSDGAGAVVVEPAPRPDGSSLRVDWIHLASHAHRYPVCMSAGGAAGRSWLDLPDAAGAEREGMLRLRQDVRSLPALFRVGLGEFVKLVRQGRVRPADVDHVLCHYSAEHFRGEIFDLLREADLMIPEERWYTNLHTRGNTGAASIFVMLEEAWRTERFQPGDRILLIVPESGRFSFAFAQLTCVGPVDRPAALSVMPAATPSPLGESDPADGDVVRWTVLELARVWADFERRVREAPVVSRIDAGTATLADYRALLRHLRQQVVEGGRWISRAASNFSAELFELRSAAIQHAAEEHRDFRLLEEDYQAVGGDLDEIRHGRKNLGSEALSAYMFHQASQPDPVDLLGAMFVIEGLGTALAGEWARRLRDQLALREDQVRFLRYHGEADDDHFAELARLLRSDTVDRERAERIVRTAEVVARLYAWQLAEVSP
jgi:3-oxoacyl-[acyl-carrier-protein] synthase-3